MKDLPIAGLAHFVMKVRDVAASYQFYADIGLRAFDQFPGMAIIELRGGTHMLLCQAGDPQTDALHPGRSGQRPDYIGEKLDLMIAGHTSADLEQYRTTLVDKGYAPSDITDATLYGHYYFSMQDPDGNGITFYTSHCGDLPV